jgi:eukaryotic translation initiation factor 2C
MTLISSTTQFPNTELAIVIQVGSGALLPLEVCEVPKGQIMRKQVPPDKTPLVLEFATKKPEERLGSITKGLNVLQYGQSEYVRSFGLTVDSTGPVRIQARVLNPPTMIYGAGSRQVNVVSVILSSPAYSPEV